MSALHTVRNPELSNDRWLRAILNLDRENMMPVFDRLGQPFPEARRTDGLARPSATVIALLRQDQLDAYLQYGRDWQDAADVYLDSLQVRRSARGTAACGLVVGEAVSQMHREEFRRLRTHVQSTNPTVVRFLTRLGFEVKNETGRAGTLEALADRSILDSRLAERLALYASGRIHRLD